MEIALHSKKTVPGTMSKFLVISHVTGTVFIVVWDALEHTDKVSATAFLKHLLHSLQNLKCYNIEYFNVASSRCLEEYVRS